jgi:phosphoglycolate phosphatase-like HAD superfamily hydrolase
MASSAGVPALAVTYGAHAEAELARLEPLACARSFRDVIGWLDTNA